MKYYTSDLHFGLRTVIEKNNRPYSDIEEMNEDIVNRINNKVGRNDTLYIGGDVACGNYNPIRQLRKIECKNKILAIGNHDAKWLKHQDFKNCFKEIFWQKFIYDEEFKILLSHFPQAEWDGCYKGILHFYGHVHNSLDGGGAYMSLLPNAYNIGVDVWNFEPMTAVEIIKSKENQSSSIQTLEQLKEYYMKPFLCKNAESLTEEKLY